MPSLWKELAKYIEDEHHCCSVKKLNKEPGKEIDVIKICNVISVNQFYHLHQTENKLVDSIYLQPETKFVTMFIPKETKLFINLFCCQISLDTVHERLSTYGLAIEGCFDIISGTLIPTGLYLGTTWTKNSLFNSEKTTHNPEPAYLVIVDHRLIKISSAKEIKSWLNNGISTQCVQGFKLFSNGSPFMDMNKIKDITVSGIQDLPNGPVDGNQVVIDYTKLQLIIKGIPVDFNHDASRTAARSPGCSGKALRRIGARTQ